MKLFKYHNIISGSIIPDTFILMIGKKEEAFYFLYTSPFTKNKEYVDVRTFENMFGKGRYRFLITLRNKKLHFKRVFLPDDKEPK